ncbi:Lrp/AsnC family transcriptional regulator [Cochlodiniinecator piscidefendens]|uniref:Lrp/AsnC family transcriptional regulator n=1 Tax=Cochlodiniinecator piscidefendens TaxID=2715756 RepID=UPI00140B1580|nr:Lrp/AsnC family transcriptional regulator [Cochlodiniinecator piscidefendens]
MEPKNTDQIQKNTKTQRSIDTIDRRILSVLTKDATTSYAELGAMVGLSAPAVHERVKRMRKAEAIKATVVALDGKAMGKSFLAFIHVEARGWGKTTELVALGQLPEVEEIHSATGDTGLILKVRTENSVALEGFLWRLYDIEGVRSTKTYVALSTYLERGVQPEITHSLAEGGNIK